MPAPDFKVLPQAIARATERSGVTDAALIEEQLHLTAGKTPEGETMYRPYWVAAELLDQRRQQIMAAEGATFRDVQLTIDALRRSQWGIDGQFKLTVPAGSSKAEVLGKTTQQRTRNGRSRLIPYGR